MDLEPLKFSAHYADALLDGATPGVDYFDTRTHPIPDDHDVFVGNRKLTSAAFEARIGPKGWVRAYEFNEIFNEDESVTLEIVVDIARNGRDLRIVEQHGNVTLRPRKPEA